MRDDDRVRILHMIDAAIGRPSLWMKCNTPFDPDAILVHQATIPHIRESDRQPNASKPCQLAADL
jgi:hypothetical protein